jgi:glycopeptide antibiotics resistance protein
MNQPQTQSRYKTTETRRIAVWSVRLLISSILFILLCTLFPFNFSFTSQRSFLEMIGSLNRRVLVEDFLLNILLFMPLGFSLNCLLSATRISKIAKLIIVLGISISLSATVEILQFFLANRYASWIDIICNGLGGLTGYLFGYLFRQKLANFLNSFLSRNYQISRKTLLAIFFGYMLLSFSIIFALPSATSLANWDSSFPLLLGNEKTGDRQWNGYIEDVYITDQALSTSEVETALENKRLSTNFKNSLLAAYPLTGEGKYQEQTGNLSELSWRGTSRSAQSGQGIFVGHGHWLETATPATRLTERLRRSSQFSIITTIATGSLNQKGPARIISQSDSPYYRNFTLGQEGSDLVLRLRNLGSDSNGTKPHYTLPNFFTDTKLHRLVITYGGTLLSFYVDKSSQIYTFDVPTDFISGGPEVFIIYHILIFVPLGYLLVMILDRSKHSTLWILFTIIGAMLPSLALEFLLASENERNIRLVNWLFGAFFTVATILICKIGAPTLSQVSEAETK